MFPRALGPQVQSPALAEQMAVAALTSLPDPPPRRTATRKDEDEDLPASVEIALQQKQQALQTVEAKATKADDAWARESLNDWGLEEDPFVQQSAAAEQAAEEAPADADQAPEAPAVSEAPDVEVPAEKDLLPVFEQME